MVFLITNSLQKEGVCPCHKYFVEHMYGIRDLIDVLEAVRGTECIATMLTKMLAMHAASVHKYLIPVFFLFGTLTFFRKGKEEKYAQSL